MKKMDEMDRNIQLHSEEWGYKTVILALCIWTIFNIYQSLKYGAELKMLPCLILCLSVCVQGFSQIVMKRKMIVGDEEYKEPNKLVQAIFAAIVIIVIIFSIGAFILIKGQ